MPVQCGRYGEQEQIQISKAGTFICFTLPDWHESIAVNVWPTLLVCYARDFVSTS